jgi:predicted ribosomally synthesized peptide with nif11-like leader
MSVESAKKFVERMLSDAEFRAEVEAKPDPLSKRQFVQSAGYDFDMADIAAVMPQSAGGELSDQELEGVAGGINTAILTTTISAASLVVGTAIAASAAI